MSNAVYDRVDKDGVIVGRGVKFFCEGDSLTKQAMKDECDINKIMAKYERQGIITHVAKREAYFADVSEVPDFAMAISVVEKASEMFMSLPAKLRARFDNDPAKYVEFCANPANEKELVELGLKAAPEVMTPLEVKVVNPVVPAGGSGA